MMSGEEGAGMLHKVTMPLLWRGGGQVKMRTHHQEPRSKDRERKGICKVGQSEKDVVDRPSNHGSLQDTEEGLSSVRKEG